MFILTWSCNTRTCKCRLPFQPRLVMHQVYIGPSTWLCIPSSAHGYIFPRLVVSSGTVFVQVLSLSLLFDATTNSLISLLLLIHNARSVVLFLIMRPFTVVSALLALAVQPIPAAPVTDTIPSLILERATAPPPCKRVLNPAPTTNETAARFTTFVQAFVGAQGGKKNITKAFEFIAEDYIVCSFFQFASTYVAPFHSPFSLVAFQVHPP